MSLIVSDHQVKIDPVLNKKGTMGKQYIFGLIFTKLAFKIDYDNILNKKQVLKSE